MRATVGGITGEATVEVTTLVPPPQQILTLYFNRYVRGLFVDQPLSVAENLVAWGAGGKIEDPVVTWEVEDSSIVSIDAPARPG